MRNVFLAAELLGLLFPAAGVARIGVGVGLGKIILEEPLQLGKIYDLPSLPVINTGDEPADYTVGVEYSGNAAVLRPSRSWFGFEPAEFHLNPGEVQLVSIRLTLPLGEAEPGDYFAYLQGRPVYKTESGGTRIGIAAATKLSFSTVPSNFLQALRYRVKDLIEIYSPWSYILPILVVLAVFLGIVQRFAHLNLRVGIERSQKKEIEPSRKAKSAQSLKKEIKPSQRKREKKKQ